MKHVPIVRSLLVLLIFFPGTMKTQDQKEKDLSAKNRGETSSRSASKATPTLEAKTMIALLERCENEILEEWATPQQHSLLPSFFFAGSFISDSADFIQPTCYGEPYLDAFERGDFLGQDTVRLVVQAGPGITIERPAQAPELDGEKTLETVTILTIPVKGVARAPNDSGERFLRYSLYKESPGKPAKTLWGAYTVVLPDRAFTGKVRLLFLLFDNQRIVWDPATDFLRSEKFLQMALTSKKPE